VQILLLDNYYPIDQLEARKERRIDQLNADRLLKLSDFQISDLKISDLKIHF